MTETYSGVGICDKQNGGRGMYAKCEIKLSAMPRGTGIEINNLLTGGSVSSKYVPAIELGIRDALSEGFLAGHPITDVRIDIVDGKEHDVDSSVPAFRLAAKNAVKIACGQAPMMILEPVADVEVCTPEDYVGAIMGDLQSRRGSIQGQTSSNHTVVVTARVPIAEMLGYATDLRSLTKGMASFSMSPSGYEEALTG